ncbi:MAG: hypothetical protein AAGG07_14045 [Planctomycetota bacterium]
MVPAVLLLHETSDGSWHYDLLVCPPGLDFAGAGPNDRVLITWRLRDRIDLGPESCLGEALSPHRWAYLTYEGPTRSGNGRVHLIASGDAAWETPNRLALRWRGGAETVYTLTPSARGVLFRRG